MKKQIKAIFFDESQIIQDKIEKERMYKIARQTGKSKILRDYLKNIGDKK